MCHCPIPRPYANASNRSKRGHQQSMSTSIPPRTNHAQAAQTAHVPGSGANRGAGICGPCGAADGGWSDTANSRAGGQRDAATSYRRRALWRTAAGVREHEPKRRGDGAFHFRVVWGKHENAASATHQSSRNSSGSWTCRSFFFCRETGAQGSAWCPRCAAGSD